MLNFCLSIIETNEDMKKSKGKLKFAIMLAFFICFCGCSNSSINNSNIWGNASRYNLNTDNTNVIINSPESGEWSKMTFEYYKMSADTVFTIQEAAKSYGDFLIDSNNIICNVWLNDYENTDIKYKEMTDENYLSALYVRYIDSDFYMDINPAGKIELYNRKELKNILGIDFSGTWSWRPSFNGSVSKKYDMTDGQAVNDSYKLNGKDVSVQNALAFASDYLNNSKPQHICSKICTYTPIKAEIYKFSEDSYGYCFTFRLNYDNVPVDASQGTDIENYRMVSNTMKLLMLSDTSVDWIWTCALNADIPTSTELCEITIDYDKACSIASDFLSREHIFTVKEAELLYCMREIADEASYWGVSGVTLEPMWQFTVTDIGVQEYSRIYLNVNACTGEVYVRYE